MIMYLVTEIVIYSLTVIVWGFDCLGNMYD